jgi:formylglycine-generating enzyme required for sulfatase activity
MSAGLYIPVDLKTPVGRADLAWMLAGDKADHKDDERSAALVRLCGFEAEEKAISEKPEPAVSDASTASSIEAEPSKESRQGTERLAFWRISRAEFRDDEEDPKVPEWFKNARPITREYLRSASRPERDMPFPLLTPWRRLWPFLRQELSVIAPRGAVDADRLVRWISECKPIRKLPKKLMKRWAPAIHLLVDTSNSLATFYSDMHELITRLRDICGKHRLRVFVFPSGLANPGYEIGAQEVRRYQVGDQPIAVLALSDLGAFQADTDVQQKLFDLGQAIIRARGRAIALAPCPPWRWSDELLQPWRMAWWDLGRKPRLLPRRAGSDESRLIEPRISTDCDKREEAFRDLLRLLSPVVRLDPELIRYARNLLPASLTDAAMEADIKTGKVNARLFLDEFRTGLPLSLRQAMVELLQWFHADCLDILHEELTLIRSVDSEVHMVDSAPFDAALAVSLDNRAWRAHGFSDDEFDGYMKRREQRLPDQVYRNERIAAQWVLLHRTDDGKFDTDQIPASLSCNDVSWVLPGGKRRLFELMQSGQALVSRIGEESGKRKAIQIGAIESTKDFLFIKAVHPEQGRTKITWPLDEPGPKILVSGYEGRAYEIESTGTTLYVEQLAKPAWAKAIGRNRSGLFVTHDDGRSFYWLNPGRYKRIDKWDELTVELQQGCWLDVKKFSVYLVASALTPDWQEHLGEDEFGLYEDLYLKGICQRFRWIAPGVFLMGSPDDEPERLEDETQHEVELTRGYWLADTACTQALWEAVMGKNPSHFKGDNRPVENISYDDCQKFIAKLNRDLPDLAIKLPTEAEWEYACRAGTTTPFWFGQTITTDQVNFDGNYPYAGGEKGQFREETVEVKSLPPNGWGLYEMHGNVYEWCSDWYGEYESGRVIDPSGPPKGDGRVLRGGSGLNFGRICRSAYRYGDPPGDRDVNVGFRLSRGQKKEAEPSVAGPMETKRSEAGTATRQKGIFKTITKKFRKEE